MKPRYKVDLTAHIADCELNYLRLRRLMPNMASADCHEFGLSGLRLRITVRERSRYTTTLDLQQHGSAGIELASPRLQVRVYHDAAMAEVVAWEGVRRVHPRYPYPNKKMYQRDEKRQWNRFLGEWLQHCLDCGYSLVDPVQLIEM